jgi:hypothetical protein
VESAALTAQFERLFAAQTAADRAWTVTLTAGALTWTDQQSSYRRDPKASVWRRLQAWFARVFRLDAQL